MKSTSSFEAKKEQSPKTTTPKVARKLKRKGSRMSSLKTQPVHDNGARSTPNYMKSTSSFEAKKEQSPKTTTPKVARKLKMDDLASENKGSRMSSLKTQPVHDNGARSMPNYMKSTSSFEARKEQTPKVARKLKMVDLASGNKGSRTSSLKKVRTLTKTTNFMPSRPLKKVILGEDLDAQRATCSSTLKESKFPAYLQLDHGGTESEGTSAMKVCQYTYCSLIGHHTPLPQKSFKVRCLSPSQRTPSVKKDDVNYQHEKTSQESKTVPEFEKKSEDGNNKNHTTIIYNIIQYLCPRIQKPEHSEADKGVAVHVHVTSVAANETDTEELNEAMEEKEL
ncbi:hypothetical protein Tco_1488751 [Tanacetum coccineum]